MEHFSFFDLFYALILSFFLFRSAKKKYTDPKFNGYYHKGLAAKFIATFLFCFIYLFYYQGGDTIAYFNSIKSFYNLAFIDFGDFLEVMSTNEFSKIWFKFNAETGFPEYYMVNDTRTLLVIKISTLLAFPSLGGYFATSILLANLFYKWIWKGFSFVADKYPSIIKDLALCFLFLPSVIFWGSGIMKDTFTFAASAYALYAFDQIFIQRTKIVVSAINLLFALYLIISIKAYILFALLPGILIYLNFERISQIKNAFVKVFILPFLTATLIIVAQTFFFNFSEEFGKYSADRILEEAAIQQQDLTREVYGQNSFDIGEFSPTLAGAASKAPAAINAALFRPYIWEVGSPTMLLSAIENFAVSLAIIYFLLTIGPFKFLRYIFKDSFLIFCLSFTIILAFGIGLSTANFGALVRYKIPFLPYFSALFFIVNGYVKEKISN